MNFLNDVNNLDLSVTLGGPIKIEDDLEDFRDIIYDNLVVGCTYQVKFIHNGISLTMDGRDMEPLIVTIPEPSDNITIPTLRSLLEDLIRQSDLVLEIYKEKNLDPFDESVPLSIFEEYDLNLSLVCLNEGF